MRSYLGIDLADRSVSREELQMLLARVPSRPPRAPRKSATSSSSAWVRNTPRAIG